MPRILVIGATGYVGRALSLSLLRSGHHTVYGLARTSAKARQLAQEEIIPVVCADPLNDPSAYLDAIKERHIDVVVDCAGAMSESRKILFDVTTAGKERLKMYEQAGLNSVAGPKLGYAYVSGAWVHGSSNAPTTDLDPIGTAMSPAQPPRLVQWRPEMEQAVLGARDVLDVVIVRPGLVYGRGHAIWTAFFAPVLEAANAKEQAGEVQIPLEPNARPSLVHVDDVAGGLHCAIDKLPRSLMESMRDVFNAFAKVAGYRGSVKLVGARDNVFAEAMSTSGNISSARAKQLLGWEPKRVALVDGMEIYGQAFIAAQEG